MEMLIPKSPTESPPIQMLVPVTEQEHEWSPFDDLLNRNCARVWEIFLANLDNTYTQKELADLAKISRQSVGRAITKMEMYGIIKEDRRVGPARLLRMVKDDPLVKAMVAFNRALSLKVADIEMERMEQNGHTDPSRE